MKNLSEQQNPFAPPGGPDSLCDPISVAGLHPRANGRYQ